VAGLVEGVSAMVVDDNPTNLRILGALLRSWGMRPEMATSARCALELIRSRMDQGTPFEMVLNRSAHAGNGWIWTGGTVANGAGGNMSNLWF